MKRQTIGLYSAGYHPKREVTTYGHLGLLRAIAALDLDYRIIFPYHLSFIVSGRDCRVLHQGEALAVDGVIIRRTYKARVPTSVLVNALWHAGIPTIDKRQAFSGQFMNKFGAVLRRYHLLRDFIPKTSLFFTRSDAFCALNRRLLPLPLLRKPIHGTRGEGIVFLRTGEQLERYIQEYSFYEPLLLQQCIQQAEEFRSIVVGQVCLGVVKKIPASSGLGNFAQGAVFTRPEASVARRITAASLYVAARSPYDVLGLDWLIEPSGRTYLIESNRNPQYKGFEQVHAQVDVSRAIVALLLERIKKSAIRAK